MRLFLLVFLVSVAEAARLERTTELDRRVEDAIRRYYPENARIVVEGLRFSDPVAETTVSVVSPRPPIGVVQFEALTKNRSTKTYGSAKVKIFLPIAVTVAPIRHGEKFSLQNVAFQEREVTSYSTTGYYPNWDSLNGVQANGYIRPGTILVAVNTIQPPVVSFGQMVQLIHEAGPLKVTARVKSLEAGRTGDWIKVENPSTRRIIRVRVTGPGEVRTR